MWVEGLTSAGLARPVRPGPCTDSASLVLVSTSFLSEEQFMTVKCSTLR